MIVLFCEAVYGLALVLYGAGLLVARLTRALVDDLLVAGGWKWRPAVGRPLWRRHWRAPWG